MVMEFAPSHRGAHKMSAAPQHQSIGASGKVARIESRRIEILEAIARLTKGTQVVKRGGDNIHRSRSPPLANRRGKG